MAEADGSLGSITSESLATLSSPGDSWSLRTKPNLGAIPKRRPLQRLGNEGSSAGESVQSPCQTVTEQDLRKILELLNKKDSPGREDGHKQRDLEMEKAENERSPETESTSEKDGDNVADG